MTVDDLQNIISEIGDACCKWKDIGFQLKIEKSHLDAISNEFSDNPQKCLTEMLTQWLRQGSSSATWSTLISILKNPTVDFQHIAEEIESKEAHAAEQSTSEVGVQTESTKQETENGKQLYKCGCKNCPNKAEIRCPNPIPVNDSFPKVSIFEGLSEDEQEFLKAKLRRDTKNIMVSFYKVLISFYDSLVKRKVPVDKLVTHLFLVKAFKLGGKTDPNKSLVHRDHCAHVKDINGVIRVIELYSSFLNYEVLEHMIEYDGSDEDKAKMQKYKEDFIQYSRRRIYECPSYTGCEKKKGHIDMIIKLDSNYDDYALSALQEFRLMLGDILLITAETLHLCKIEDGCIKLTFQIPNFVYKAVFPLSAEQEKALLELNVIQLTCGKYHFPRQGSDKQV